MRGYMANFAQFALLLRRSSRLDVIVNFAVFGHFGAEEQISKIIDLAFCLYCDISYQYRLINRCEIPLKTRVLRPRLYGDGHR